MLVGTRVHFAAYYGANANQIFQISDGNNPGLRPVISDTETEIDNLSFFEGDPDVGVSIVPARLDVTGAVLTYEVIGRRAGTFLDPGGNTSFNGLGARFDFLTESNGWSLWTYDILSGTGVGPLDIGSNVNGGRSRVTIDNDEIRINLEGLDFIQGSTAQVRMGFRFDGGARADEAVGLDGRDDLRGNDGNDSLQGGGNDDRLSGGANRDWLEGGAGDDTIEGGAGDDTIEGGRGADRMAGGDGIDRFVFRRAADIGNDSSNRDGISSDRISDFTSGEDLIDLRAMNVDFAFIGRAQFSGEGPELRFAGRPSMLIGDVDGDGQADFRLWLPGATMVSSDVLV